MKPSSDTDIVFYPPIFCSSCPQILESTSELKKHIKAHQAPVIQCKFCGKRVKNKDGLAMHEQAKHALPPSIYKGKSQPRFQKTVGQRTQTKVATKQEQARKAKKDLWICKFCPGSVFESHGGLKRHRLFVHKLSVQCDICRKVMRGNGSLIRHTRARHEWPSEPSEQDDNLDDCGVDFVDDLDTNANLETHPSNTARVSLSAMQIVLGKARLPQSEYSSEAFGSFRTRVPQFCEKLSHPNSSERKGNKERAHERTNKCSICGFVGRKSTFDEHTQTRHGELLRPLGSNELHTCKRCPWSILAANDERLKEHNALVHGVGARCDNCGKITWRDGDMARHVRDKHQSSPHIRKKKYGSEDRDLVRQTLRVYQDLDLEFSTS